MSSPVQPSSPSNLHDILFNFFFGPRSLSKNTMPEDVKKCAAPPAHAAPRCAAVWICQCCQNYWACERPSSSARQSVAVQLLLKVEISPECLRAIGPRRSGNPRDSQDCRRRNHCAPVLDVPCAHRWCLCVCVCRRKAEDEAEESKCQIPTPRTWFGFS